MGNRAGMESGRVGPGPESNRDVYRIAVSRECRAVFGIWSGMEGAFRRAMGGGEPIRSEVGVGHGAVGSREF
jgi:hypothetical protein